MPAGGKIAVGASLQAREKAIRIVTEGKKIRSLPDVPDVNSLESQDCSELTIN